MKIGYWLGNANLNYGGTAPYAWRVLELLLSQINSLDIEIMILCSPQTQKNCLELINKYQARAEIYVIPPKINIINRVFSRLINVLFQVLVKFHFPRFGIKYQDSWLRWFASLDIELLHFPYQTPPRYSFPYPFVVTMHDVQELHYPEFFTPQDRAYRAEHYWKSLKYSSAVVVSFNHVKHDLIKYFGLPDSKIYVCPIPYQNLDLNLPTPEQELAYERKYAQWKGFLLYPAQTWQHKNHLSLIKAIKFIKDNFARLIPVLCTGKKNPGFFPVIEDYLHSSGMAEQIHFLGIVPETELYWLYKNCSLVVIPTLYEAGSFPLLEAMSLGASVICSSITSLPESIGDTRFIFDPLNVEQMAKLIIQLLDDSELRAANIENGRSRIEQLRKINTVTYLIDVWKKTIDDSLENCSS